MVFYNDWIKPLSDSTNDLSLTSRAYYWTAAAVQSVRLHSGSHDVSGILTRLNAAKTSVGSIHFKNLMSIFILIIEGTQQLQ